MAMAPPFTVEFHRTTGRISAATLASIALHVIFGLWILLTWHKVTPSLHFDIRLIDGLARQETPLPETPREKLPPGTRRGGAEPTQRAVPRRQASGARTASRSIGSDQKTLPAVGAPPAPSGGAAVAGGEGAGLATVPGGVDVGPTMGTGAASGSVGGAPARQGGGGSGTGTGTSAGGISSGRGSGASAYGPPPGQPDRTVIAIPPTVRGNPASFDGAVYIDADRYVLHGADLRTGVSVAGNELCVDGNLLRTVYRVKYTQPYTDIAQCTNWMVGSDETWLCPKEAEILQLVFDGYLASPLNYSVNTCLEYDKTNCFLYLDGGEPTEACRPTVKYEGIWDASTQFRYRCVKSEVRRYSHPLQYQVRFMQDIQLQSNFTKRIIARESRQIPKCEPQ